MRHFAIALLGFTFTQLATVYGTDLGADASTTPYDAYMTPVKQVLSKVNGEEDSMGRVRALMNVGHGFRYSFTQPYTPASPELTQARHAGDCKDKALWLISNLNDDSVRFVIGKARRSSSISHAWVMWQHEGKWWILDCTNRRDPIPADRVGSNSYIPMYSFAKNGSYRHDPSATLFASNSREGQAAVAASTASGAWGSRR